MGVFHCVSEFSTHWKEIVFWLGWGDTEESATSVPTFLQNDSTEKSVDSQCII